MKFFLFSMIFFFFLSFVLFFLLSERESENAGRGRGKESQAGSVLSLEPDVGCISQSQNHNLS